MDRQNRQVINFLKVTQSRFLIDVNFRVFIFVISSVVSLCMLISLMLFLINFIKQENVNSLKNEYGQRHEIVSEYRELTTQSRGSYIGRLPDSFTLGQIGFYGLLHGLSQYDMDGAWLSEIYYDHSTGVVRFNGYGVTPVAVERFVNSLKTMRSLQNVHFELFVIHNATKGITDKTAQSDKDEKTVSVITVDGQLVRKIDYGGRFSEFKPLEDIRRENAGKMDVTVSDLAFENIYNDLIIQEQQKQTARRQKGEEEVVAPYIFSLQNVLSMNGRNKK